MTLLLGFFGLISSAAGIALGFFAWHNLCTASRLGRPLSYIAKLRPGYRKVRGKVAALDEVLRSPVTNKECVYYRLRVYQESNAGAKITGGILFDFSDGVKAVATGVVGALVGVAFCGLIGGITGVCAGFAVYFLMPTKRARTDSSRNSLVNDFDCVPLTIDDESGLVEVEPDGADVVSKAKSQIISNRERPIPPKLADLLLEEYDLDAVDDDGKFGTPHILEEALLVGAKVTVIGPVVAEEAGSLCFQTTASPLLISDGAVGKQARDARQRAIGFCVGAGLTLVLGLICLLAALALVLRTPNFR